MTDETKQANSGSEKAENSAELNHEQASPPVTGSPSTDENARGNDTFPRAYVEELRKENASFRVELRDLQKAISAMTAKLSGESGDDPPPTKNDLKTEKGQELFSQMMQQFEAVQKRLDEADTKAKETEIAALKMKYGAKYGLDEDLIDRLRGSAPDEIEADAKNMAVKFGKRAASGNAGEPGAPSVTDWHPLTQRKRDVFGGGGVSFKDDNQRGKKS